MDDQLPLPLYAALDEDERLPPCPVTVHPPRLPQPVGNLAGGLGEEPWSVQAERWERRWRGGEDAGRPLVVYQRWD